MTEQEIRAEIEKECKNCKKDITCFMCVKDQLIESRIEIEKKDKVIEAINRWFNELIVRTDYDRGYGSALKSVIDRFNKE